MIPTQAVIEQQANALVSLLGIPGLLGSPASMKVGLAKAAFVPTPARVFADMVEATFPGYAAKAIANSAPTVYIDAQTGYLTIHINEPVGGFVWESNDVPLEPETIYGFYLYEGVDVLLGTELLPSPITITGTNQGIAIPDVRFRFRSDSPF